VGQGGQEGRLAEAYAAARLSSVAEKVGGGAHLLVALSENRRMSKDYERLCATAETFIYVAMTRLMVRRLARA
jgi:hypothetical protein